MEPSPYSIMNTQERQTFAESLDGVLTKQQQKRINSIAPNKNDRITIAQLLYDELHDKTFKFSKRSKSGTPNPNVITNGKFHASFAQKNSNDPAIVDDALQKINERINLYNTFYKLFPTKGLAGASKSIQKHLPEAINNAIAAKTKGDYGDMPKQAQGIIAKLSEIKTFDTFSQTYTLDQMNKIVKNLKTIYDNFTTTNTGVNPINATQHEALKDPLNNLGEILKVKPVVEVKQPSAEPVVEEDAILELSAELEQLNVEEYEEASVEQQLNAIASQIAEQQLIVEQIAKPEPVVEVKQQPIAEPVELVVEEEVEQQLNVEQPSANEVKNSPKIKEITISAIQYTSMGNIDSFTLNFNGNEAKKLAFKDVKFGIGIDFKLQNTNGNKTGPFKNICPPGYVGIHLTPESSKEINAFIKSNNKNKNKEIAIAPEKLNEFKSQLKFTKIVGREKKEECSLEQLLHASEMKGGVLYVDAEKIKKQIPPESVPEVNLMQADEEGKNNQGAGQVVEQQDAILDASVKNPSKSNQESLDDLQLEMMSLINVSVKEQLDVSVKEQASVGQPSANAEPVVEEVKSEEDASASQKEQLNARPQLNVSASAKVKQPSVNAEQQLDASAKVKQPSAKGKKGFSAILLEGENDLRVRERLRPGQPSVEPVVEESVILEQSHKNRRRPSSAPHQRRYFEESQNNQSIGSQHISPNHSFHNSYVNDTFEEHDSALERHAYDATVTQQYTQSQQNTDLEKFNKAIKEAFRKTMGKHRELYQSIGIQEQEQAKYNTRFVSRVVEIANQAQYFTNTNGGRLAQPVNRQGETRSDETAKAMRTFSVEFQQACARQELFYTNREGYKNTHGMRTKSILDFLKKHNLDENNAQNHIARLIGGAQHENGNAPKLNFRPDQQLNNSLSNFTFGDNGGPDSEAERIDKKALNPSNTFSFKGSTFSFGQTKK